jgi:hypothetical protein
MTVGGKSKVAKDIRTRRSVRGARGHFTNAVMPEPIDGYWSKQGRPLLVVKIEIDRVVVTLNL